MPFAPNVTRTIATFQNFPPAIIEICLNQCSLLCFSLLKNLEKHTRFSVAVLKILATMETFHAEILTCGAKIPLNLSALTSKKFTKLIKIFKCWWLFCNFDFENISQKNKMKCFFDPHVPPTRYKMLLQCHL